MSELLEKFREFGREQDLKLHDKLEEMKAKPIIKAYPGFDFAKPKPTKKILGDKELNKNEIVDYLSDYIKKNKNTFTLDWLRGQKLTFESVNEMRKERAEKLK